MQEIGREIIENVLIDYPTIEEVMEMVNKNRKGKAPRAEERL